MVTTFNIKQKLRDIFKIYINHNVSSLGLDNIILFLTKRDYMIYNVIELLSGKGNSESAYVDTQNDTIDRHKLQYLR